MSIKLLLHKLIKSSFWSLVINVSVLLFLIKDKYVRYFLINSFSNVFFICLLSNESPLPPRFSIFLFCIFSFVLSLNVIFVSYFSLTICSIETIFNLKYVSKAFLISLSVINIFSALIPDFAITPLKI